MAWDKLRISESWPYFDTWGREQGKETTSQKLRRSSHPEVKKQLDRQ